MINPKLNNDRIVAQQGLFLCCSNKSTEGKIETNNQIKKRAFSIEAARKIIISKEHKKSILKELEFLGIKKSVLFPELENHANELIEKFAVKQVPKNEETEKNIGILFYKSPVESNETLNEGELEKSKNLILEIKSSSIDMNLKEEMLSYIDEDFYLFDSKKAIVKKLIRRNKNIENELKNKLIELIGE